jgi:hypothetical protein
MPTNKANVETLLYHLREGRENDYPFCCSLRFTFDMMFRPDSVPARERGIVDLDRGAWSYNQYVPCLWFHKPTRRVR